MTHIFLIGDIQIGKSTVIKKVMSLVRPLYGDKKPPFGGFCTYFGSDRANPERCLYMNDAASAPVYDEEHIVVRFRAGYAPEALPERFNTLGTDYVSEAKKNTRLIIMDECGRLERDAHAFQNEVLNALDDDVPILGVVKAGLSGWTDAIRRHPKVRLMIVDRGNREMLPCLIAEKLSGFCCASDVGSDITSS